MTITTAPPLIHWNDEDGLPHCGAPAMVGETQHGHRDRDEATCPSCVPQPGTLIKVRPDVLLLERNIRETKLDKDFVASIKDLGVLEPITAVLNHEGDLVVRFGHRRTLAAAEACLRQVPVYVAGSDDLEDSAEVDRIIRQHDENTRRSGLTAGEEIGVVEQLAAFGLSPAQIVKRKRMPRAQVDAALTVSQSSVASEAAAEFESLTLDQAAALAEFEDDPEAVEVLIATASRSPGDFAHQAQRIRDDRADQAARAEVAASLEKHGVRVVEQMEWWKGLTYLKVSAGGAQLTKVNHAKCPGHVAWVAQVGWADNKPKYEPVYGCEDYAKHGHFSTQMGTRSGAGGTPAADMSDDEREKAKQQRALVIGNNKAWVSAETVRREWLTEFAKQKTAPKGAAVFIARAIEQNSRAISDYTGHQWTLDLLGIKASTSYRSAAVATAAEKASEGRALQMVLVQVLAGYEEQLTKESWREDGKSDAGHYLRYLESVGYLLSDVEKYAISGKRA